MIQLEPSPLDDIIRVLHVDHEQSQLELTKSSVEISDSTIHMESVAMPEAALRRLEEEDFDCIVSDYQMPGLNGIEFARRIRGFSDIPIILYTGKGSEEVAEKAFEVGINDYIRKEINPSHYQVLARRIRSAVEERRAVDALIRSEENHRTLLEQLPDPVTVRIGDKRVYVTERAAEFLGYDDVSELLVEGGSEITISEDWPIIVDRMERRKKGEELPSMYEIKMRKADGSTVDVEVHTAPIDYQGTPAILNILRDITERKRAEETLASSEKFLNNIIEQSPVSLWISDSKGTLIKMNQSCRELFGATDEEAVEKYNLFKDNLIEEQGFMPLVENVFKKGEIARFTIDYDLPRVEHVKVKGARHRILDVTVSPIKDKHGEVTNALVQHKDITERRRAEQKLEEYRGNLEEMVEQRTKDLRDAQEQLVRQEKLAVLGQLAGGIGHELRNPLGAIKNAAYFLDIALEDTDPEVKETVEILGKEVETSERIINSLLDYARSKPPTKQKTDINQVVQEALSKTTIPDEIKVQSQMDETLPTILADPDQLAQVFGNIILNAVQAMPKGGQLTVKSEASSPEMVAISFSDTGVGISEENLGKIWEPLFTTKAKGIGLGLPIIKTMVEAHGGTVEVESTVGEGTTFTVKLPLSHVEGDRDE